MSDTKVELGTSVAAVLQELPVAVRQYLAKETHSLVVSRLMGKFKLTHEQGVLLEREVLLLLLGVESIHEFGDTITSELGLDKSTTDLLLKEIGQQILVPLSEEIEKDEQAQSVQTEPEDGEAAPKTEPVAPIVPPVRQAPVPQVPVPSYVAPPLQSPRYVRSESPVAEAMIAPMMPRAGMPRPHITLGAVGTPAPVPAPATPAPKEAAPVQATPTPAPLEAAPVTPAPQTPAAPAAAPAAVAEPVPAPTQAKQATPLAQVSYTADPYREPI